MIVSPVCFSSLAVLYSQVLCHLWGEMVLFTIKFFGNCMIWTVTWTCLVFLNKVFLCGVSCLGFPISLDTLSLCFLTLFSMNAELDAPSHD